MLRVKRYGKAMAKKKQLPMPTLDELIKLQMEIRRLCGRIYSPPRAELNRMRTAVEKFRTAKDKSGKRRYPKFSKLRVLMGSLMETSQTLREMPDGQRKLRAAYLAAERISNRKE